MKQEAVDSWLESLEHLHEVEVPDYLPGKIRLAIAASERERVSPGKIALAGVALGLLLTLNVLAILHSAPLPKEILAGRNLGMFADNDLYK